MSWPCQTYNSRNIQRLYFSHSNYTKYFRNFAWRLYRVGSKRNDQGVLKRFKYFRRTWMNLKRLRILYAIRVWGKRVNWSFIFFIELMRDNRYYAFFYFAIWTIKMSHLDVTFATDCLDGGFGIVCSDERWILDARRNVWTHAFRNMQRSTNMHVLQIIITTSRSRTVLKCLAKLWLNSDTKSWLIMIPILVQKRLWFFHSKSNTRSSIY